MQYGLDHLFHATRYRGKDTSYFDRVDEWRAKRDAIAVLLEDMPSLIEAARKPLGAIHPTSPHITIVDPRPGIRLIVACEGIANTLYSAAEIAANFANIASKGAISSRFSKVREACDGDAPPEFAAQLGDLQWYRKVRELRTEWAHFSSIFIGIDENSEPLLCVRSFRRVSDRKEFVGQRTFCRAHELSDWVERATENLERFAGYLLTKYVIPLFEPEQPVTWVVRDELGFPLLRDGSRVCTERVTYREFLRRGGIEITA
jgi:hypothetical protein